MAGKDHGFMVAVLIACIAGAMLIALDVGSAEELPFSDEELARLERGDVLLRHVERELGEDEYTSLLVSAVWVRHEPKVIWEVLNHPEREKEWIPTVVKSEVVEDKCRGATSRENTTDYMLKVFGFEVYYSLVREYDYEAKTIKAHMDKDRPHRFFQDIQAGWDFFPYKGGVIFQYWSDSKLAFTLPAFISEALAERTLTSGAKAVAERCDNIAEEMKNNKVDSLPNPCVSGKESGEEK